ncbi:enamine deaminase RidA (YjgF/YER057c/UK114 family) [Actinoplanes tereljensis]|uniref:Enamine deaminase RidA n=1 Tax=Paractinoplanes tereljensis TaxID=571912 RepID=A0A919NL04_9ACTN|nr:RidA family protein [Actinoplanes tereljensis]GIF20438.1 enamine deaminase RidA [Actinoplanes tereljensis]
MTIERLNPPTVFAIPDLISQAVTVGGLLFLSGQVAWDTDGALVGAGDHAAQAAQIADNITALLTAASAAWADVIKETIYVVDYRPDLVPAIFTALRRGPAPASTLVPVPALFQPGFLLEVEVVAAI